MEHVDEYTDAKLTSTGFSPRELKVTEKHKLLEAPNNCNYESMNVQGERSRDPIVMIRCAGFEFQKEEPILSL